MSENLDHPIDLNSDVVSVEPENDVVSVAAAAAAVGGGVSDSEPLKVCGFEVGNGKNVNTDSGLGKTGSGEGDFDDKAEIFESVSMKEAGKVSDFEMGNTKNVNIDDGLGKIEAGEGDCDDKAVIFECVSETLTDKVSNFEVGNGISVNIDDGLRKTRREQRDCDDKGESFEGVSVKAIAGQVSGTLVEENCCSDAEGNGDVSGRSSVVCGDEMKVEQIGVSGSLTDDVVQVVVKENDGNDVLCDKKEVISDPVENMVGRVMVTEVSDVGVSLDSDGNKAKLSNLVVDFKLSVSTDEDVEDDGDEMFDSEEPEFNVGDLIWGKVMSHPWWPGQIFDPSDSTKKAKKYFKKGTYLIAYFGDQTFAWNDVAKIKPFRQHFTQMEKQSDLEEFHYAVDCVLDEVSRRVEFGLACPCVPEYTKIKTQTIVNAGIREDSCRRDGGDSFSAADAFEPAKLLEYVKVLGEMPFGGVDRLEFVTAQAQLLAFNRWKGYTHLPEFKILVPWLDNDAIESQQPSEMTHDSEVEENAGEIGDIVKDEEYMASGLGKSKSLDHSPRKRKHISVGSVNSPNKKEKSLADMMAERRSLVQNGKSGLDGKSTPKLHSSSSGKKRKDGDHPSSDDSMLKRGKVPSSSGDDNKSSECKSTFRVGDSILRVASQLNGSSPILKSVNGASQKSGSKNKSKKKSLTGQPQDHFNSLKHEESSLEHDDNIGKESTKSEIETSESEYVKDTVAESICEEQSLQENQNDAGEFFPETPIKKGTSVMESQSAVQLDPFSDSNQQVAEAVKPVDHLGENSNDDPSPTALILNFTNLDSVPSETNLNKIFSQYGVLKESETEVLKKSRRAKVVFCRRADAEAAFSSAGKYSIFGPSLVSYRLKYMPSPASKSSPNTKKPQQK